MPNTPILVDISNNGYRLSGPEDGVLFDLDSDGNAELVSWTLPDTDDCWLAMDSTSFATESKTIAKQDRWGNLFRLRGSAVGPSGKQNVYDVYLKAHR